MYFKVPTVKESAMKTFTNTIKQLINEVTDADHLAELEADLVVINKMVEDEPITDNDARRFQDIVDYVYPR